MLSLGNMIGFVPITQADRALSFYTGTMKLKFVQDDQFAIVLQSGPNMIRLVRMKTVEPLPFTILGWEVSDIEGAVAELTASHVSLMRYPFLDQHESGIWTAPGGNKIAWFQDPDGNLLSLSQH